MPVTNYDTLHGEIIAEYTDGVQLDYLKDALGSVTAWIDQNCNIVATARYKPFGDILVSTGTLGRFTWVGTLGYRSSGLTWADKYVRARHYGSRQGQWTTVDPIWPKERAYGYVNGNPMSRVDPSGNKPLIDYAGRPELPPGEDYVSNCCEARKHPWPIRGQWLYNQVRNGGPWDYKQRRRWDSRQRERPYENAGNFHYGYIAACVGFPLMFALRGAGWAQSHGGNGEPENGTWWGGFPFGDDPKDQWNIILGYLNALKWMSELDRRCSLGSKKGCYEHFKNWRDHEIDRINNEGSQLTGPNRWWER